MTIRPLNESDIPILKGIAEQSGYPYPDLASQSLEAVLVVADENDQPIMAVAAERLIQAYLWCGAGMTPHEKVSALRLLHDKMVELLKQKGYSSIEAFLPPNVSERFGRRLEKTFGWTRNWRSWNRGF